MQDLGGTLPSLQKKAGETPCCGVGCMMCIRVFRKKCATRPNKKKLVMSVHSILQPYSKVQGCKHFVRLHSNKSILSLLENKI